MQLTITQSSPDLIVHSTAPTVIEPGKRFVIALSLPVKVPLTLESMEFTFPDDIEPTGDLLQELLPYDLQPGEPLEFELEFQSPPERESFGIVNAHVTVSRVNGETNAGEPETLTWEHWLSVFAREVAPYPQPLSDRLRQRLIEVTNYYLRNAHIFMADFVAYFDDYLNIEIGEDSAAAIVEELPFSTKGLPLDPKTRLAIARGTMSFYGITDFIFQGEEECEEFDPVFQATGVQDVDPEEVEV